MNGTSGSKETRIDDDHLLARFEDDGHSRSGQTERLSSTKKLRHEASESEQDDFKRGLDEEEDGKQPEEERLRPQGGSDLGDDAKENVDTLPADAVSGDGHGDGDEPENAAPGSVECSSHFDGSNRFVVRLRGLPWSAREREISDFFVDEKVREIQIVYLTDGRASGEALVEFDDAASFQSAFLKNRDHIGHRYIEIFKSTAMEMDTSAGRARRPPARPPRSQHVIRMRGLPYTATEEDVFNFFGVTKPTGTHLIKDDLGRPSGEGFVEFGCEVDAIAAMAKHRHHIGHRYIELFRSSPTELMRALGLTTGWQSGNGRPSRSSCVLMRGLPYSCTESEITKFFQQIEVTPIRIHRKADGAEAYIEFCSALDTDNAMTRHRSYIGNRYVELFRVSYHDMAQTVGLPLRTNNASHSHSHSDSTAASHSHSHSHSASASSFALNPSNVMGSIPAATTTTTTSANSNGPAPSAVSNAQAMVNQAMSSNFAIPPLSITPHYGSAAHGRAHYSSPPQAHHGMACGGGQYGGQYGGRYVANPLLSATNVANSLLSGIYGGPPPNASTATFASLQSHGGSYDGLGLCSNGQVHHMTDSQGGSLYYPSSYYQ